MSENLSGNELLFLDALTHDAALRKALVNKDFDTVMQRLHENHIQLKDLASLRTAIEAVNWTDLGNLERQLNHRIDNKMG
jgi:hypothetical protein